MMSKNIGSESKTLQHVGNDENRIHLEMGLYSKGGSQPVLQTSSNEAQKMRTKSRDLVISTKGNEFKTQSSEYVMSAKNTGFKGRLRKRGP